MSFVKAGEGIDQKGREGFGVIYQLFITSSSTDAFGTRTGQQSETATIRRVSLPPPRTCIFLMVAAASMRRPSDLVFTLRFLNITLAVIQLDSHEWDTKAGLEQYERI
jgi:hypothetical protein